MDIKPIIVQKYLESLKEDKELDAIFPMLLQSMGFEVLSTPKEYKGFSQYGKDLVAVKDDDDGTKKRFYFELKAGNIDGRNWNNGPNGVRETLTMTIDHDFETTYPKFKDLPIKVVLVFNGMVSGKTREQLNGFVKKEFHDKGTEFVEWNIYKLTELFADKLFGEYLLTDIKTTKLFNRILVNLNTSDGVSDDFVELIDVILTRKTFKGSKKKLPRKWILLFESLRLISLIIYTESKEYNNLDIAKRYLTHLLLRFWYWILKNKLESNQVVMGYFQQILIFYYTLLCEYLKRTMPFARLKDGLASNESGRYEEIGYTYRTIQYLQTLCFTLNFERTFNPKFDFKNANKALVEVINQNSVSARVLLDIDSIVILDIINLLLNLGDVQSAKNYLKQVLGYIRHAKSTYGRLPDANNNIRSVIELTIKGEKPIYYIDSTSPLIATLLEYLALFDMEDEFYLLKEFVKEHDIDLGIFVPHHSLNSSSKELIEDTENDLEEQLFSKSVRDGYQAEISFRKENTLEATITFEEFQELLFKRKDEFTYEYRTDKAGYPFLRDLAHHYFHTPYFPDTWRNISLNSKIST
ncbi:hypothetical protein [Cytophaga sp. FL35]|uniref:hypothetical protein n=1 Tax=Cytophaga sp. FL35 TaxID=1904456 RepID=UPI001653AAE4|nr:hypothetical protein [Cytophaga sp. FL35]MBC7000375.1 hypothetical protein [Cytophaga sp. FL35]